MRGKENSEGMLSPYRVLDLTEEKGFFCGKLLGDLGADVIKIERPGGDPARKIGPFYHDEVHPEKSLFWFAFNNNKRGVTLDIETTAGRETFKRLVKTADFVIESFPPGYLDKLGLGYSALEKLNPGIIMVSITPFGQTGPYKDYRAPDIVAWAMGGVMFPLGDADRPPIRISHHSHTHLHAAADGAVGAMVALHHREKTGEGQHVDVSIQDSVVRATYTVVQSWDMTKVNESRISSALPGVNVRMTRMWPCKDGYVMWFYFSAAPIWNLPTVRFIEEAGMADDFLKNFDWSSFNWLTTTQEIVDHLNEVTRKFFLAQTKAELLEGSVKHECFFFPVATTKDIAENAQLAARGFWAKLEHPELGTTITYPGAWVNASGTPPRVSHRAPLIGEHNREVLEKEIGLTREELLALRGVKSYPAKSRQKSQKQNVGEKPLAGVKVADFSWVIVGPISARALADYGAQVIKIEGKGRPDALRSVTPPYKDGVSGLNRSGTFNQYNTGKMSLALNLAQPKGKEIARKLVAWADIVMDSFAGGSMPRMGLGYEELKKIKPDIIMLSTCMQGQTGPHHKHPGFGYHLAQHAGLTNISGWPDREPSWLGPYTDYVCPHFNVLAILSALDYRRRTGKGQYLDMSQYENAMHFMSPLILDYVVNQREAFRMGNRYPYAAPHGVYRCRGQEKWCALAVVTEEEWRSCCRVIGNPAWARDSRFATLSVRKENEDELEKLVEEWTINHSAEEVMTMMQTAGVAAGVLQTGEDLLEHDPQLKHRRLFRELDHPEVGKHHVPAPPFALSKSPCELSRAPLLGEHNEYVLKQVLGLSDEAVAQLVIEGVVE